jgi:hypothetical protein
MKHSREYTAFTKVVDAVYLFRVKRCSAAKRFIVWESMRTQNAVAANVEQSGKSSNFPLPGPDASPHA